MTENLNNLRDFLLRVGIDINKPRKKSAKIRKRKSGPSIGMTVKVCPGKRHAWFESSSGLIRKPV